MAVSYRTLARDTDRVRVYARAVVLLPSHDNERAAAARLPQTHRRRSATGPGRERGLAAIREQGRVVADYWTTLKARKR